MMKSIGVSPNQVTCLEDVISSKTKTYVHKQSYFFDSVCELSQEMELPLVVLKSSSKTNGSNIWLRDYFYKSRMPDGSLCLCVVPELITQEAKYSGFNFRSPGHLARLFSYALPEVPNLKQQTSQGELELVEKIPAYSKGDPGCSILLEVAKGMAFGATGVDRKKFSLEGGDLFTVKDPREDAKMKYIVGAASLAHMEFFSRMYDGKTRLSEFTKLIVLFRAVHPNFITQKTIEKHKQRFKKAVESSSGFIAHVPTIAPHFLEEAAVTRLAKKHFLAAEFNGSCQGAFQPEQKRSVVIMPQWAYHIDLQMAYLGNGIFALHSFAEAEKFLIEHREQVIQELGQMNLAAIKRSESPEELFEILLKNTQNFKALYEESIVLEARRKLLKHGFKVITCCGTLFTEPVKAGFTKGVFAAFVNGMAIESDKKHQKYFATAASPLRSAQNYFADKIKEESGLEVKFLTVSAEHRTPKTTLEESTVIKIDKSTGSLRCQLNTALDLAVLV